VYSKIITDRETGRSKGFGFVEFATIEDATAAKEAMDGIELDGREIKVDFAEEKPRD
jgi:RNA recognition motif-containing protein